MSNIVHKYWLDRENIIEHLMDIVMFIILITLWYFLFEEISINLSHPPIPY